MSLTATPPLRLRENRLRCTACGDSLPGRAAGYAMQANYAGPVLLGLTITGPRGAVLHECGHAAADDGRES